ncbi:hypothetical protein VTN02DRAFT_457 [Thermoascus thermophilus]
MDRSPSPGRSRSSASHITSSAVLNQRSRSGDAPERQTDRWPAARGGQLGAVTGRGPANGKQHDANQLGGYRELAAAASAGVAPAWLFAVASTTKTPWPVLQSLSESCSPRRLVEPLLLHHLPSPSAPRVSPFPKSHSYPFSAILLISQEVRSRPSPRDPRDPRCLSF